MKIKEKKRSYIIVKNVLESTKHKLDYRHQEQINEVSTEPSSRREGKVDLMYYNPSEGKGWQSRAAILDLILTQRWN